MNFLSRFFAILLLSAMPCISAFSSEDVVSYGGELEVYISQGILPVRVQSSNSSVRALVGLALGVHGAFDTKAPTKSAAVINIEDSGDGLRATSTGSRPAFRGSLSVAGTSSASVMELCDKIIVAVGETYSWKLKPLFSKTRIAFSSNRTGTREIYFSDLLFRSVKQATGHKSISIMPRWDPSGKRLLYTTYHRSGAADVYFVDVTTGAVSKFAAYPNSNNGGGFSPDGSMVALALSARGPMNVYVKPAAGGNARQLARDGEVQTSPVFSPDGKTILFVSGPTGSPRLYTVPASGGKKRQLLAGYSNSTEPAWSRAAPTKIAFSWKNSISIYDTSTREVLNLGDTIRGHKIFKAAWCADGRHIVAAEESGKRSFLVIIDTEGGKKPKITRISPASMKDCFEPDALVIR